jgi:hypothetical protein
VSFREAFLPRLFEIYLGRWRLVLVRPYGNSYDLPNIKGASSPPMGKTGWPWTEEGSRVTGYSFAPSVLRKSQEDEGLVQCKI